MENAPAPQARPDPTVPGPVAPDPAVADPTAPDPAAPDPAPGLSPGELDAVRARRAGLRRAGRAVRELLPAGAGDRPVAAGSLDAAVGRLAEVWDRHRAQTEADDGVLAQVLVDCPRLAPAIDRLRRQHGEVARALAAARAALGAPVDAPSAAVDALVRVLDAIDRHRHDGRELLYDAYQVDLGLGE